jgi:nucleotide-binding universal stress UspA family protein
MTTDIAFSRVLVATDFSKQAERAWNVARQFAAALDAELVLVHVLVAEDLRSLEVAERIADEHSRCAADQLNVPRVLVEPEREAERPARHWAEGKLEEWAGPARASGRKVRTLVRAGVPHTEIVAAAEGEHADLVVVGTHGRDVLQRLLIGSVADRVVRTAPCPVLVVR